jgi:hypothetical protein
MYDLQPGSSPLSFVGGGLAAPQQQQYQPQKAPAIEPTTPAETNAERNYRDAANLCEVATPIALGSAVVFAFHSLQVAGGAIIPIGIYSIYLGAKLGNPHRRWSTAIVGVGVAGGMLASLAEPIGEWQQSRGTQTATATAIRQMQPKSPKISNDYFWDYLPSIALAVIILALTFKGKKQ